VPQTVRLMLFCYDLLGGFAFLDPARLSSAMQALSSYFASGQDAPAACAQSSSDRIGWTTSQGHFLIWSTSGSSGSNGQPYHSSMARYCSGRRRLGLLFRILAQVPDLIERQSTTSKPTTTEFVPANGVAMPTATLTRSAMLQERR
jgi:hypothetical protein